MSRKNKRFINMLLMTISLGVFSLAIVMFIILYEKTKDLQNTQPEIVIEEVTYTQEEVNQIAEEAEEEAKKSILSEIQMSMEKGVSPLTLFKSLYPDYIVVLSQGTYHFVDKSDTIKHNNYDSANIVLDEETGICTYVDGDVVVSKKGIDVSSHQGHIDWKKVAADGVEFAFIRVGYRGYESGKLVEDKCCADNLAGASAAGIDMGAYFFSQAINTDEAIEEAQMVLDMIEGYNLKLPIVYDVERVTSSKARMNELTKEERTEVTKAFLEYIRANGHEVMLYHNTEMGALLLDFEQFEDYEKWFAGYTIEMYWPYEYKIWQYSDHGKVDGIKTNVDLNIMLQ